MKHNDRNYRDDMDSLDDELPEIDFSGMDFLEDEIPSRSQSKQADFDDDISEDFDFEDLRAELDEIFEEEESSRSSESFYADDFDSDREYSDDSEFDDFDIDDLDLDMSDFYDDEEESEEEEEEDSDRNMKLVPSSRNKMIVKPSDEEEDYYLSTDVEEEEEEEYPLSKDVEDDEYADYYEYSEEDFEDGKKEKSHLGLKIFAIFLLLIILAAAFLVLTTPGRSIMYDIAAKFIYKNVQNDDTPTPELTQALVEKEPDEDALPVDENTEEEEKYYTIYRSEDYVKTYLLFGIEEIDGASNTDSIMLVSINTKDNTIKMTSILRDTYVDIPGYYPNKINAAFAYGCKTGDTPQERKANGAKLLMTVIENTYDVDITGYAYVNFSAFENIINRLGGIDIELGEKEAAYLRKTNYISKPEYRTVQTGWNHMNGNQALGYCRVRKVATLGGANNDYGRTVRQRRVLNAIIQQYKNSSLTDLLPIMADCLSYVTTNLNEKQISDALHDIVEHQTFTTNSMRLPYGELFYDSGKSGIFNGKYNVTYTLVIDAYRDQNIKEFHKFLFLDEDEEEKAEDGTQPETAPAN